MSPRTIAHRIPTAGVELAVDVHVPAEPRGIVVFAHGVGSSRHSPRNRAVAEALHTRELGTVLVDLLTEDEEQPDATGSDIDLLAERLTGVLEWLRDPGDSQSPGEPQSPDESRSPGEPQVPGGVPLGLFGASTGAAAALACAAARPDLVGAIVSRGGRPDLVGSSLGAVRAPTLLIVGSYDESVIELNQQARTAMTAHNELVIVPTASHLFTEPGTLDAVAEHAAEWFLTYLSPDTDG